MRIDQVHFETFKQGSKTYFNSSIFFPEHVRKDVFILYGFVRKADNFIDVIPQNPDGYYQFKQNYQYALNGGNVKDSIVQSFVELVNRKGLKPEWVDSFFRSMEMDLTKSIYHTVDETLEYIFGSAEVIGLFMAKILDLPAESYEAAKMQGRAMQYINFIRDIKEDLEFGRRYLPVEGTSLKRFELDYMKDNQDRFIDFIRHHVSLYRRWQKDAENGYRHIPKRYLVPIKTASDMYGWTARKIENNPLIVFQRKVKPSTLRVVFHIVCNSLILR